MQPKKILTLILKLAIGVGSFAIIYSRLKNDFTTDKIEFLKAAIFSGQGLWCISSCILLIPVNWGIESYKWQLITAPIQKLSYLNATKSVYSGVCLGNLAPGRATEFVAKILFFDLDKRPQITLLHFVNGMFQLSITIICGLLALVFRLKSVGEDYSWLLYTTSGIGLALLILLLLCIWRMDWVMGAISKLVPKLSGFKTMHYRFTGKLLLQLFGFSLLRYLVFFLQFVLLLYLCQPFPLSLTIVSSIALYFLITTTIPMISVLEAAIRAAVALLVFKDCGIENTALALSSVLIWLVNIIVPSVLGYYFLLKQNFNFRFMTNKHE